MHVATMKFGLGLWVMLVTLSACSSMTDEEAASLFEKNKPRFEEVVILAEANRPIERIYPYMTAETDVIETYRNEELDDRGRQAIGTIAGFLRDNDIELARVSRLSRSGGREAIVVDFIVWSRGIAVSGEAVTISYFDGTEDVLDRQCADLSLPRWKVCRLKS
jgi:hypothetical protein